jgi:DNA polymerase III subunit delta
MLIYPDQLNKHLSSAPIGLYVVVGDEPLAKTECLDQIRHFARHHGAEERSSFTVERQFNWQQITQFNQSSSLFSTKRILEIHIPNGKPGIEGAKALTALAEQPPLDTSTIITLPTLDRDAKNSSWYTSFIKHALVIELKEISIQQLPAWIAQRLAQQQQTTDDASLAFIAHQVEGNLLAAHQEIQKLALLYPQGVISAEEIKDAVLNVARFDAYQLGEAMLQGDSERTVRILEGLKEEGEQPVAVMNPLTWLIRPLLRVKLAMMQGETLQSAMASARVFGDKQVIIKRALDRLNLRQIEASLHKLAEIDRIAKGVKQGDAWLEISRLCFGLARIKAKSR